MNNKKDNPHIEGIMSKFWDKHGKNIKYFVGIAASAAASALARKWMENQSEDDTIED